MLGLAHLALVASPAELYLQGSEVNLRAGPTTGTAVVAKLPLATRCQPLAPAAGGWIKVRGGERDGYVLVKMVGAEQPALGRPATGERASAWLPLAYDWQSLPVSSAGRTVKLDRFVARKIASGRYQNASEVLRAGLRVLEQQERAYEAKLARLRKALDEGEHSGLADGDPFARVRGTLRGSRRR